MAGGNRMNERITTIEIGAQELVGLSIIIGGEKVGEIIEATHKIKIKFRDNFTLEETRKIMGGRLSDDITISCRGKNKDE